MTTANATLRRPRSSWLYSAGILLVVLAVWVLLAFLLRGRHLVPTPADLVAGFVADAPLLAANLGSTMLVALQGFLLGVVLVIPLAVVSILAPVLEPVVQRVAVAVHVIPFVAIAPIIIVSLPGDEARIVITALQVYFPLLINLLLGLHSADDRALDVVTASGGRSWAKLRLIRGPSAAPQLVAGLQIAAPAAVLGALISEFFGADRGFGALLITAQDQLLTTRVWEIAVTIGLVAALAYGVITLLARLVVPWAGRGVTTGGTVAGAEDLALPRWQNALSVVASAVVLIGGWWLLRPVLGLQPYFAKDPVDVTRFLLNGNPDTGAPASAFWHAFATALGQTGVHTAIGFVVGTVVAIAGAILFVIVPGLERAAMPYAIVLRSLPLIALTPLIVMLFGRGLLGVTVLVTLVTFFPTLVTVTIGLRSAPENAIDVIRASGGSSASSAFRVRIVYAIPAITAASKVAVPAAVSGALLAEWLATGDGLGSFITQAAVNADYYTLWAAGALVVVLVLALYTLINLIDRVVSRRLGIAY